MEKKIIFLKYMYITIISFILPLYLTYSMFIENLKDSLNVFSTFSPISKIERIEIVYNKKGEWWYLLSGGFNTGNYGYVSSKNLFVKGKRGFNIILFSNKGIEIKTFDTHKFQEESQKMVEFIQKLPDSCVGIIYVKDEASNNLTPSLQNVLNSLGADISLKNKYRWSYVFIFEKRKKYFHKIFEATSPDKAFLIKLKV